MADETPEQAAMAAATVAVRQILAQAKNPKTTLGRMKPTSVAFHAAWAAIGAYHDALEKAKAVPRCSKYIAPRA